MERRRMTTAAWNGSGKDWRTFKSKESEGIQGPWIRCGFRQNDRSAIEIPKAETMSEGKRITYSEPPFVPVLMININ
jgi:hypothetical protein